MVGLLEMIVAYTSPKSVTKKIAIKELLDQAKYTIFYFYPKDQTPGCTIQAREFSVSKKKFTALHTQIIGISKDTSNSHCRFQDNEDLTIGLISDKEKILHQYFHALAPMKFMGKEYMGTMRNTYLLDNQGAVLYKWENVEPLGHATEVLEQIQKLQTL